LKGDAPSITRVSLLVKKYKKEFNRLFSTGMLLVPEHSVPVGTDTPNVFAPMGMQQPDTRSTAWTTSYPKSLKHIDFREFKS
jgi:hypothetical protein